MNEKNLPIKVVLQRERDSIRNIGGGSVKFFGEVTKEIKEGIINDFQKIGEDYAGFFDENPNIPAVGRVKVKPEAIAKSHKPVDLCRHCPIIGTEDLDEIYIKVTKEGINETIELIKSTPSQKVLANLTAILDIKVIQPNKKISEGLKSIKMTEEFDKYRNSIKVKLFDFNDEVDNSRTKQYFFENLRELGIEDVKEINYGKNLGMIKIQVNSFEQVEEISKLINVKFIDYFQEYTAPITNQVETNLSTFLEGEGVETDLVIGIIDSGIADNDLLSPFIYQRKEYVAPVYQNRGHGTFIASTILYGNTLNNLPEVNPKAYKFLDVVAIPNSDSRYGQTDSISEDALVEIIEEVMNEYSGEVKIWNMSLGIESQICNGNMSDLGKFLDYIQDEYEVQIFVSSGNLNNAPLRRWPSDNTLGEMDRIIAPADSVRAITVGSVALYDSNEALVKVNEPSPFSRRGPGANYIVKPDIVDYGGNVDENYNILGLGMKGLNIEGHIVEANGTSFSTPRALKKYADIYDEMVEKDLFLAKGLLIHSARMNAREMFDSNPDFIKYYGYGLPQTNINDVLNCSSNEVTLVFKQKIYPGTHLEMYDFPYPECLIDNGKCYGEIGMTLLSNPVLNERFGKEYCRVNIDASFGVYQTLPDGKIKYNGKVPAESAWDEKFEQSRVEHGFKWSPIKSYYKSIKNGIELKDGWKIRVDMTPRDGEYIGEQEFILIVTIKDPTGTKDVYSDVINGLRTKSYVTSNLETRHQIRQRN